MIAWKLGIDFTNEVKWIGKNAWGMKQFEKQSHQNKSVEENVDYIPARLPNEQFKITEKLKCISLQKPMLTLLLFLSAL